MSYGVKGGGFAAVTAKTQEEFINTIKYFDTAPQNSVLVYDDEE